MCLKRVFISFPMSNTLISSFAVRLLTGKPTHLIRPLLQSLKHDMLAKNTHFQDRVLPQAQSFETVYSQAYTTEKEPTTTSKQRKKDVQNLKKASAVRSVQRMYIPEGKDAYWLAEEYLRWLPQAFQLLIRAEYVHEGISRMYLRGTNILLLELTYQPKFSSSSRAIYTISDGALLRNDARGKGTFEFRIMLDSPILLTAIHDFHPQLPWFIYTLTQAQVHALVMHRFAKHLASMA